MHCDHSVCVLPQDGARAHGTGKQIASLCVFFPACPRRDLQTGVWLVVNLSFVCVFFNFSPSCGCWARREQGEVSQQRLPLSEKVCVWEMHWSEVEWSVWGVLYCQSSLRCIWVYLFLSPCVCACGRVYLCAFLPAFSHSSARTMFYFHVSVSFASVSCP